MNELATKQHERELDSPANVAKLPARVTDGMVASFHDFTSGGHKVNIPPGLRQINRVSEAGR